MKKRPLSAIGGSHRNFATPKRQIKQNEDDDENDPSFLSPQQKFQRFEKKSFNALLDKIRLAHDKYKPCYSDKLMRPLIDAFRVIVRYPNDDIPEVTNATLKSRLRLYIPDTVVYGIYDNPVLYYTDESGYVVRVDNVSNKKIFDKFCKNKSDNELTAVMKRPLVADTVSNHASLFTVKQLKSFLEQHNNGLCIIQKFIHSKGPKSSIVRCVWSATKPTYAYVICNKKLKTDIGEKEAEKRLMASAELPHLLRIFKIKGKATQTIGAYTEHLMTFIKTSMSPWPVFEEFICDYIKDAYGTWWFIQVKGFIRSTPTQITKIVRTKRDYMRLRECTMCAGLYPPSQLCYSMTYKMMYVTEQHLKKRAIKYPWFDRPEFQSARDTSMWYTPHKVCKSCYDMYLQEQKISKVEEEFARAIGIPVNEKANESSSIISALKNRLSNKRQDNNFEEAEQTIPENLIMFRFITYINDLRKIPDEIPEKFYLKLKFLESETIVPLQIKSLMDRECLSVSKLRVFYFFTESMENFHKFILKLNHLRISMHSANKVLGHATLQLKQFASGLVNKLDFLTLFSSRLLKLCSLRVTLGFVKMEPMDLSSVKLEPYDDGLIYLPQEDFFTADPLPDEWMEFLPQLSKQLPLDKLARLETRDFIIERSKSAPAELFNKPNFVSSARLRPQSELLLRNDPKRPNSAFSRHHMSSFISPSPSPKPVCISKTLQRRSLSKLSKENARSTFSPTLSLRRPTSRLSRLSRSSSPQQRRPASAMQLRPKQLSFLTHSNEKPPKPDNLSRDGSEMKLKPLLLKKKSTVRVGDPEEMIWKFSVKIGSVCDLTKKLDEIWVLSYELFKTITKEYESFQIVADGQLIFDVEDEVYLMCTEKNLNAFFTKEKCFKIAIYPKFAKGDERMSQIEFRNLTKSKLIDVVSNFERVENNQILTPDNEESEDENPFGEEEEEDDSSRMQRQSFEFEVQQKPATVKVTIEVIRIGTAMNFQDGETELPILKELDEFSIKILKEEPERLFPSRKESPKEEREDELDFFGIGMYKS